MDFPIGDLMDENKCYNFLRDGVDSQKGLSRDRLSLFCTIEL
jgi:hypothetical protein